jgi:hypothetical protein
LECLREEKSWITSAARHEDNDALQSTLFKFQRALEDILEKLDMPALDLYTTPAIVRPAEGRASRGDSQDRMMSARDRDVSPDPINSLIEATQLNGLRSQLRSSKQRRKGGMSRRDHDLISEKLITMAEAEEMLSLFKCNQSQHLFSAAVPADATVETVRASSTTLFTAIMLVAALYMPGREALHETLHGLFMGLVSSVMFDRFHTLDDIRGLAIAAFWQPYLSWKLSGMAIRMATELNLHHAFYTAFADQTVSVEERNDCLEKTRLWYLLYVLDHQSSITYGRPPVMSELRPIKDFELLLTSDLCSAPDRILIAQVSGLVILSRAFEHFGLNPKRVMTGDDASVLNHLRFTENIQSWRDRWTTHSASIFEDLQRNVELQFHFSNLVLNSLVLRGRPLANLAELPSSLRPLALKAVEAAHSVLQRFLDDPKYVDEIVGMPLYLHSMIAFAAVFLMKMAHKWQAIGITIDADHRTIPLVEAIIKLLKSCKSGANHMIFSMAEGFERMLRQLRKTGRAKEAVAREVAAGMGGVASSLGPCRGSTLDIGAGADYGFYTSGLISNMDNTSPGSTDISGIMHSHWGFQDDEMWSVGMGYDLLEPGSQGLASIDFPLHVSNWL